MLPFIDSLRAIFAHFLSLCVKCKSSTIRSLNRLSIFCVINNRVSHCGKRSMLMCVYVRACESVCVRLWAQISLAPDRESQRSHDMLAANLPCTKHKFLSPILCTSVLILDWTRTAHTHTHTRDRLPWIWLQCHGWLWTCVCICTPHMGCLRSVLLFSNRKYWTQYANEMILLDVNTNGFLIMFFKAISLVNCWHGLV